GLEVAGEYAREPLKSIVGLRSPVPMNSSVAWLQRGCGTCGLTLAQKPYSDAWSTSHRPLGRWSVKVKRTIDLIDLKPYFQGTASRIGGPITFGGGLP